MSYILDALRRADAERERGAVPGLQSQQHAYVDDDAATPTRPRALVWAVAGLSLALLAAIAWNVLREPSPPPPRPVVEGSVAPPPVLLPTSPAPQSPTAVAPQSPVPAEPQRPTAVAPQSPAGLAPQRPAAVAPQGMPAAAPPVTGAVPPLPGAAPAPGAAGTARAPARPTADAKRTARPSAATAAATPVDGSRPGGATGETRIYKQIDLPEDIRRELPKLTIGGASYSGDAASRMVMINGQIFHEGAQLAPNLVLERIKLKSAVLSYRGYRYEVTF